MSASKWAERWADRKRKVAEDNAQPDEVPQVAPESDIESGDIAAPEPTELPSLESLNENSDYSAFMQIDVDKEIRKLALRKLFSSPAFNIRDGLDDYDDDYTQFVALGDTKTADLAHRLFPSPPATEENSASNPDEALQTDSNEPVDEDSDQPQSEQIETAND
ncbi:MAG: DUF3306 domain-containing protein [Gammaproteobacteria bacterium]|nr:DUF3306 domain-containing protein [Gammaproteobacteria bacterium]